MEEEVSFEALLKLRDQVGLKSFKEFESQVIFKNNKGTESKKSSKIKHNSDEDEAPVEISSKTPFKKQKSRVVYRTRDPRFDNRIGKFNEEKFKKNYEFAFNLREEELKAIKNSKQDEKKKYLIQRIENQKRESAKKRNSNKKVEVLPDGNKFYKTKKLQRTEELVNKFVELKKSGKLEKHLDKRRKKQAGKERKKLNIEK